MTKKLDLKGANPAKFLQKATESLGCTRSETALALKASSHALLLTVKLKKSSGTLVLQIDFSETKAGGVDCNYGVRLPKKGTDFNAVDWLEDELFPERSLHHALGYLKKMLENSRDSVLEPSSIKVQIRRTLSFLGLQNIVGEYSILGWCLTPHMEPNQGIGEKIVWCRKEFDKSDEMSHILEADLDLERLAVALSVFWCNSFTSPGSQRVWTFERKSDDPPEYRNCWFQRGVMGGSDSPDPIEPGEYSTEVDRLEPTTWPGSNGFPDGLKPPSDSLELSEMLSKLRLPDRLRFFRAAKAYCLSSLLAEQSITSSFAYLVVGVEALMGVKLEKCETCDQAKGFFKAFRSFIFSELPCLESTDEVKEFYTSLLGLGYEIRSRHFHDGHLEELGSDYLVLGIPLSSASMEFTRKVSLFRGVLNGLLVNFVWKSATGELWPRSAEPIRLKQYEYFSVGGKL